MSKSLYIHIPFCRSKCIYCDFLSFPNKENLIKKYINYLDKEMNEFKGEEIETIFLGGGTPSLLSIDEIKKILVIIKSNFNLKNLKEFTFEANPDSLTEEKIDFLIDNEIIKITRFSLGIQSFDDEVLKKIGRHYSFETAKKIIKNIRLYKDIKLNIDLILGFTFETNTIEKRKYLLEEFLEEFFIEHVSLYMLNIAKNTLIYDMIKLKKISVISDEDILKEYEIFTETLIKNNYIHYEISNFSYGKHNKCIHNLSYWEAKEYLGIGLGASSYVNFIRWKNPNNFENFFKMLDTRDFSYREKEKLNINQIFYEKIFLGLRLLDVGINLKDIEKKFFKNRIEFTDFSLFLKKINDFCEMDFLLKCEDRVYLTKKGIFLSDYIVRELIDII